LTPRAALAALEASRIEGGPATAAARLPLLLVLDQARLASAREVARLHELLCFLRAYPGSAAVLTRVEAMLAGFAARADLGAYRAALADTGIAGTAIHYRFFGGQAMWLADRWPAQLRLDRAADAEADALIARALPQLVSAAEAQALVECRLGGYAALDRLRGAGVGGRRVGSKGGSGSLGDGAFLARLIAGMPGTSLTREAFSDAIDASYVLEPGPDTPSRTAAVFAPAPRRPQQPPVRGRPDLRAELQRAPRSMRRLTEAQGRELADLARAAMVTRARALEAFSVADARDAWLVDDGHGLAYALIGVLPERRYAVPALYGGLTLRNGVPIGYLQADITGPSAALSFNTFETFRGAEAAFTFARWLAALKHLFGTTSFTIEPYQLGKGNPEGLESGAWWFYFKLGFRPRDRGVARLAREELRRVARGPSHRTGTATLRALAEAHLFFDVDAPRALPRWPALGLQSGAALSAAHGADRAAAVESAALEVRDRCGITSWRGFGAREREGWRKLAPVVATFDLSGWSRDELDGLAALMRAKGARSERDHVQRVLAHAKFQQTIFGVQRRS
jgi:hypothetical protein